MRTFESAIRDLGILNKCSVIIWLISVARNAVAERRVSDCMFILQRQLIRRQRQEISMLRSQLEECRKTPPTL